MIYQIQAEDIGKQVLKIGGETFYLKNSIGYIQRLDVGKRIKIHHGILSMENEEQFKRRVENDGTNQS